MRLRELAWVAVLAMFVGAGCDKPKDPPPNPNSPQAGKWWAEEARDDDNRLIYRVTLRIGSITTDGANVSIQTQNCSAVVRAGTEEGSAPERPNGEVGSASVDAVTSTSGAVVISLQGQEMFRKPISYFRTFHD